MDEQLEFNAAPLPRRRRKTRMDIIKEAYLPYIFLSIATLFVLIFIIGALIRNANAQESSVPETDDVPSISYHYEYDGI